ncbi:alpha-mannosidase [Puniceicoccales bacterium CK1056]|uniref:Alpha-mannosidase n=1 Tax=Oceanipulchritudo coccoides TaxID=2706888 RepID=A0A6B2LY78_9BACT|nr:glycoside hydrolase family 38 C-terminal domain-containing protein [Oceanipulchritudo coccoides]NDV61578.1 alpha-mannosidase [Oceanipulchritudo coccoides]
MQKESKQTAIVVGHTHWDREWRYPIYKNRSLLLEFMDWLLEILETDEGYAGFLLDGQTVCLQDYLEIRPENRGRIEAQVKAGRLWIGPWYTLPDLFPVSGECLLRSLLKGIRYADEFGGYNPIAYHTFGWGQTAQFPQIYESLGIKYAVAAKKVSEERAPHCEFLWTAPDGSTVLASRLGHFGRQNGYFYLHFPVRLNNQYDDNVYAWKWGETGLAYHRADADQARTDYFRIDHEQGYFKENVKAAAQRTWDNMDKTMAQDWRLLMCGCDFSTPNPHLPRMVRDCNEAHPDIEFRMGSLEEYFKGLEERIDRSKVPVVDGELRDGEPCGASANALATRIHIKQLNKKAENVMIRRTEPLAACLFMNGHSYPEKFLEKGWEYLLKAHAHDSINGVTQDKTVEDNIYRLNQALEIGETIYDDTVAALIKRLDLSEFGEKDQLLLIHNPQPRPVREVIRLAVDTPQEENVWAIGAEEADGTPLEVQMISRDEHKQPVHDIEARPWPFLVDRHEVYLDSGNIPAGGYKVVRVVHEKTFWREEEWWPAMRKSKGGLIGTGTHILENENLKVEVNPDGTFDLTDKSNERSITGMHAFEDEGDTGDYWAYYPPCQNQAISSRGFESRIWMEDNGPLSGTICIEKIMRIPSRAEYGKINIQGYGKRSEDLVDMKIVSKLSLTKGARQLRIKTKVENKAKDHRLRVMIPSDIKADFSDAAGHFTVDRRHMVHEVDQAGKHYPEMALRPQGVFCSVSDDQSGLSIVNNCLTEFQLLDDERRTIALTLFRAVRNRICTESRVSAEFPDQLGSQILQTLEFEYSICPHKGSWIEGKAYPEADRLNARPAVMQISRNAAGDLPHSVSLYEIDNDSIILSTFKKAEDEEAIILRIFNPTATSQSTNIRLGFPVKQATMTNLNEVDLATLPVENNQLSVTLEKGKIVTIMLK